MVSCEAHHYCPFWPCMSFPRRQFVHLRLLLTKAASLKPNTRPGSKCCQNIGHQGARAKEYPSFPSVCWDEVFWWEVHMSWRVFSEHSSEAQSIIAGAPRQEPDTAGYVKSRAQRVHTCLPVSAQLTTSFLLSPRTQAQRTVLLQWAESLLMDCLMKTSAYRNVHKPHN